MRKETIIWLFFFAYLFDERWLFGGEFHIIGLAFYCLARMKNDDPTAAFRPARMLVKTIMILWLYYGCSVVRSKSEIEPLVKP